MSPSHTLRGGLSGAGLLSDSRKTTKARNRSAVCHPKKTKLAFLRFDDHDHRYHAFLCTVNQEGECITVGRARLARATSSPRPPSVGHTRPPSRPLRFKQHDTIGVADRHTPALSSFAGRQVLSNHARLFNRVTIRLGPILCRCELSRAPIEVHRPDSLPGLHHAPS
jgi:hypothetical protein